MSRTRPTPTTFIAAAGAALLVVSDLVEVHGSDSPRQLATNVAAHPDRWMASYSLQMLGALVLAAAVTGLARNRSGRGGRLVAAGGWWFAAALVGLVAEAATELMLVPVTIDGATAAAVATVQRMDDSSALAAVFLLYLPGIVFGPLLLAAGLARARRTTWWVFAAITVATLAGFVGTGSVVGSVATAVQLAIVVWWCATADGVERAPADLREAPRPKAALA